jgi:hypothetical protein
MQHDLSIVCKRRSGATLLMICEFAVWFLTPRAASPQTCVSAAAVIRATDRHSRLSAFRPVAGICRLLETADRALLKDPPRARNS